MPTLNTLIAAGAVCQCLREKKMFYESAEAPVNAQDIVPPAPMPAGPFWCAHTQSIIGPDGQLADAERCRPGRACCETP